MEKGGRTKRIFEELRGLSELGHDVGLVTFSEPPEWVMEHYDGSSDWKILPKGGGIDLRWLLRLYAFIRDFQPDIIDAQCEGSALYAGLISRFVGCRCVATIHRSTLRAYERNWRIRLFYRFVDGCVAVSEQRRQLICHSLAVPDSRVIVIHWGISTGDMPELPSRAAARQRLGLGAADPVLLSIGHLGLIKGHDDSISAMSEILDRHPGAHLYIAGDGDEGEYRRLRDHARDRGVEAQVTLLGQTSNIFEWLRASDVFLQPSREEAFGLVFLEAAACEVPAVATRVGGIPEIIVDGETGLLVAPESAEAIASAVSRLLASPELASAMGSAARERVQAHFELRDCVGRLSAHLEKVADPSN